MMWLLAIQLALGPVQHYRNAKQEFSQRKFSEAVGEVDAALLENPSMVPALVLKARLATLARRPDVAKSCLITAVTVDPHSEEAQFYLGLLFYVQNEFKTAVPPLQAAQALAPKDPLPLFYLAMTHQALGDVARALAYYEEAETLSPEKSPQTAEILVADGKLLLSLGRTEEGIAKDRKAVQIDPKSRDAHYELAKGLDHKGDFRNAAVEGNLALALPGDGTSDAQIHFLLAALYRKLNRPDLAQAHLDKFLAATKAAHR
jgi:tetratricopeptide (TPR) repeat protein